MNIFSKHRSRLNLLWLFLVVLTGYIGFTRQSTAQETAAQPAFDPPALYAVWTTDPTTTISILWNTRNDVPAEANHPAELRYRPKNMIDGYVHVVKAESAPFPHSNRTNHRADLKGLQPGSEYSFRIGADSRAYSFRTMPATLDRPLRFAAGGDTMHERGQFEKTNLQAMKHDLDFVMFGGDLAYENGKPDQVQRIYDWLDVAKKTLITPEGRLVPIIVAIGNHEVQGGNNRTPEDAPYFYSKFPFPGVPGYNVLDFGNYLSIISLDTGHTAPIAGAQTEWLEKTLEARKNVPHVFPIYHVPIYPSVRAYSEESAQRVNWEPLFEKYGVKFAFENHDHAYKRTHPIRDGKIAEDGKGVVYLGDGAWGVGTRELATDRWYIAKSVSVRHFILGTVQDRDQKFDMIDEDGNLIDSYPAAAAP